VVSGRLLLQFAERAFSLLALAKPDVVALDKLSALSTCFNGSAVPPLLRATTVTLCSASSILSRVSIVRRSTSALVMPSVEMGGSTIAKSASSLPCPFEPESKLTLYGNGPRNEFPALNMQKIRVVGDDNGHYRHLRLDGQVKGTLFKGQQVRLQSI
jgi:hypothetical protein